MANLTLELIKKAKTAKTAEELQTLTKENGMELTEEEAKTDFQQLSLKSNELSDDQLEGIAGGEYGDLLRPITICHCNKKPCIC